MPRNISQQLVRRPLVFALSIPRMLPPLFVLVLAISSNISLASSVLPHGHTPPPPVVSSGRSSLTGSAPSWANVKNYEGPADPSSYVGFRVYLGWNNPTQVEALARAVSDPRSSSYGQYLSPAQFRQEFAPSQSQVGVVQSWLRSQGFTVEYTPANNHYVSAEGTVSQAQVAFRTSFGMYTVGGLTIRSPSSDITVPSTLAGIVSGILGLDDSVQFVSTNHTVGDAPPPPAFVSAQPCSSYCGEKQAVGLTNPYGNSVLPY